MQQDIEYIRKCTAEWGQCKCMALTTQAAVVLVGRDGYAYSGNVPRGVIEVMEEARANNMSINDVILKENGGWMVIYNDYYDVQGEMIPRNLCDALSYIQARNGRIFSADWEKGAKIVSAICTDIDIKGLFPNVMNVHSDEVISILVDNGELFISTSSEKSNTYSILRDRDGHPEKYYYTDGNLTPYIDPDISCPLYPIIHGQVQNAHMIKVFYGSRYFVANKDGSQYYFYI